MLTSRALLSTVLFAAAIAACGPRAGGPPAGGRSDGVGRAGSRSGRHGEAAASPSPTPIAWAGDARRLLALGLGAGAIVWNDPAIRPGETLLWHIIDDTPGGPREVRVSRSVSAPESWEVRGGSGEAVELSLSEDRRSAARIAWTTRDSAPAEITAADALAALYPAPGLVDDASFASAGGTMLGNEVVRVPAGTFRARHGSIQKAGFTWHFYVAKSVPGGVVKIEKFADGAEGASLVLELEEFKRVKPAPAPTSVPPASVPPPATPAPAPSSSPSAIPSAIPSAAP